MIDKRLLRIWCQKQKAPFWQYFEFKPNASKEPDNVIQAICKGKKRRRKNNGLQPEHGTRWKPAALQWQFDLRGLAVAHSHKDQSQGSTDIIEEHLVL